MSFDVYVQVLNKGKPGGISLDRVRDAFGTAVIEFEPDRWKPSFEDQNSCEVYLSLDAGRVMLEGLSIYRPCGDLRLWDALASIHSRQCRALFPRFQSAPGCESQYETASTFRYDRVLGRAHHRRERGGDTARDTGGLVERRETGT
jgi:hypothetical protein